jgi:hypothetical protein
MRTSFGSADTATSRPRQRFSTSVQPHVKAKYGAGAVNSGRRAAEASISFHAELVAVPDLSLTVADRLMTEGANAGARDSLGSASSAARTRDLPW